VRIFVSYAHEQRNLADRLAIGLRQSGAEVFFDKDALQAGQAYDQPIREEIERCDLFVFLLSPESLADRKYALTELAFARDRWPDPTGHVLPVAVSKVQADAIPPYLAAVGVLFPEGNVVAETLAAVARIKRSPRRALRVAAAAAVLVAVGAIFVLRPAPVTPNCLLSARVKTSRPLANHPVKIDVTTARETGSFTISDEGAASLQAAIGKNESWHIDVIDSAGVAFKPVPLSGCPIRTIEVPIGDDVALELRPP
jgi:hypothetical protein